MSKSSIIPNVIRELVNGNFDLRKGAERATIEIVSIVSTPEVRETLHECFGASHLFTPRYIRHTDPKITLTLTWTERARKLIISETRIPYDGEEPDWKSKVKTIHRVELAIDFERFDDIIAVFDIQVEDLEKRLGIEIEHSPHDEAFV